ncbi:hypothetical protein G9C98_001990 [Cotesia typhae]|uniref:Breast cancer anti-estrogen resistance protein 1 n=1 Tax=Cotesia typhae TaxID=2053667 RepID=A0A8J5R5P9_9HYME|nr:hypothetical protein G9C98_001990 [Cotesia typhae]
MMGVKMLSQTPDIIPTSLNQGICPGNRLRLLVGQYDTGGCLGGSRADLTLAEDGLQRHGKRRSWHVQPNRVITPQKCGDVYLYDLPVNRASPAPSSRRDSPLNSTDHLHNTSRLSSGQQSSIDSGGDVSDCYDVPPRATPVIQSPASSPSPAPSCYDTPRPPTSCTPNSNCSGGSGITPLDCYDIPRPLQPLTPSSSASSLTNDGSLSGSNRSSITAPDYDIPRPRLPSNSKYNTPIHKISTTSPSSQNLQQRQQIYDVPVNRELPLELDSALEGLEKLQSEASAAIARLLGFVSPGWRTSQRLDTTLMDLRLAALRLRTSLHDLAEFAEGTLGNASKAPDKGLVNKFRPLVKALRDSDKLVKEAAWKLDAIEWDAAKLSRNNETKISTNNSLPSFISSIHPDPLDQLIACARALTEDVRQIASFIQRSSIISTSTAGNSTEDDDYVNLDSRETVAKQREELRATLPQELRSSYDLLVSEADNAAIQMPPSTPTPMDPNDKQLLAFYVAQVITHGAHLTHAIDAFLQTVEHNQPPKVFLAHGKFVVLSAHRLVHIGDTVHRNVTRNDVRTKILECANSLSEALAQTVLKTKQAAQFFPSVTAVQEMVDSVVDVSHLAKDLKVAMIHAAQQP